MSKAYLTCIFSVRYITLRKNTSQHFSTMLGGYFKQQYYQQKAHKLEKCGTEQTVKRTLVYSMRAETRRQNVASTNLSWGHVCQYALRLPKCEKGSQ